MQLKTTFVQFPEIKLATRDAHKLRGYFGNLFREHSELLHNHFANGKARYKYPLVQYKVIDNVPCLTGLQEGGKLLIELFLKIKCLNIGGKEYLINAKNITNKITEIGDFSTLHDYRFATLWMALNQDNYLKYQQLNPEKERNEFLNRMLQNNILSFYKGVDYFTGERIMARVDVREKSTKFKDQRMIAFKGNFVTNAVLPERIGLGKSVSRGFGTVLKK